MFWFRNIKMLTTCTCILLLISTYTCAQSPTDCVKVYCKTDPCTFFDPLQCTNHPNAVCKANYCGGCVAEIWENGKRVTDCIDLNSIG